jgi:hypothetical protein
MNLLAQIRGVTPGMAARPPHGPGVVARPSPSGRGWPCGHPWPILGPRRADGTTHLVRLRCVVRRVADLGCLARSYGFQVSDVAWSYWSRCPAWLWSCRSRCPVWGSGSMAGRNFGFCLGWKEGWSGVFPTFTFFVFFLFHADMSTSYWWAEMPWFLPPPNRSYTHSIKTFQKIFPHFSNLPFSIVPLLHRPIDRHPPWRKATERSPPTKTNDHQPTAHQRYPVVHLTLECQIRPLTPQISLLQVLPEPTLRLTRERLSVILWEGRSVGGILNESFRMLCESVSGKTQCIWWRRRRDLTPFFFIWKMASDAKGSVGIQNFSWNLKQNRC